MSDHSSSSSEAGSSSSGESSGKAISRHLPRTAFAAVEYPSTVSHPSALLKVITQDNLNKCFNMPSAATGVQLEMSYKMDDKAGIPVRGTRVPSAKLLLRVKRRRRRDAISDGEGAEPGLDKGKGKEQGVFVAEVVGSVTQTVRFRQLADYHYTPDPEGRIQTMVNALRELNYEAILDYSIPDLDEEFVEPVEPPLGEEPGPDFIPFRSRLDLQPTPLFSQRVLAPAYGYKNAPQSVLESVVDPYTGETRMRYINKARVTATGPQRIGHGHPKGGVPKEPVKTVKDKLGKLNANLLEKLRGIFERRPVWLRHALFAQLTKEEERLVTNEKAYIAATCYAMGAGPYWKCLIRFGYDPVYDPNAYIYQRVYFYFTTSKAKTTTRAQSIDSAEEDEEDEAKGAEGWAAEQERKVQAGERPPIDRTKGHIFNGKEIHRSKPDYQLCDITDPLIRKYIDDPNLRVDTCDSKDGWYKSVAMTAIKNLCRLKYAHVREHGREAPNELCFAEIERLERGLRGSGEGDDAMGDDTEELGVEA